MDIPIAPILILLALLLLSAFFSSAEIGIFSMSRMRIQHLFESGVKDTEILNVMYNNSHKTLTTILLGNNLVNIAASAIATALAITLFASWGVAIATVVATAVMTLIILLFCEIIPKSYSFENEKHAIIASRVLYYISMVLFPFVWIIDKLSDALMKILGLKRKKEKYMMTQDELKLMVNIGEKEGAILPEERKMINNVLEFNDIEVGEVMVHRTQIHAIDISATDEDIRKFLSETPQSYVPVYKETLDNIKGILRVDELLTKILTEKNPKITVSKECLIEPYFVPGTMRISELFKKMKKRKIKMAVVVDEYGGTSGIVTMEDILEEIVGDMPEEWDENSISEIDKNTAIFSADTEIEDVGEFFGEELEPDDDYRTLAGCIMEKLRKLPNKNEFVNLKNFKFTAEEVKKHKIIRVKVTKLNGGDLNEKIKNS
ncbi:MAG: hemolysin [Firmicutes bacterium HGW-Firmicutes-13]|nr:MAG: hemolysin [Firmicutes bacterium HGW-Firmicutes-13]